MFSFDFTALSISRFILRSQVRVLNRLVWAGTEPFLTAPSKLPRHSIQVGYQDQIFSREKAKNECDWAVMTSVFVASQSSCFSCLALISYFSFSGGPWVASASNARLYMRDDHDEKRIGSWCAAYGQTDNQWLQVDLGQVKYVSAVATQGTV
jgi:hypothetical protein